jgi:RNase P subunit RPR2
MKCWHCRRIMIPPATPKPTEGHVITVDFECKRCGSQYRMDLAQRTEPKIPVEPISEKR